MKLYGFNKANEVVAATEVETYQEMRELAYSWNKEETRKNMKIHFIGDQPILAHGTRVSTI